MKKRLLFLCREIPWPVRGGAILRNYWLLKALSAEYDIDLVAATSCDREIPAQISDLCASSIALERSNTPSTKLRRLMLSLRLGSYFLAGCLPTRRLKDHVEQLLRNGNYAAIHVEQLGMYLALPRGAKPPVVYDAHNCESELFHRRADVEAFLPMKMLLLSELRQITLVERTALEDAQLVLATSSADKQDLSKILPSAQNKITVIPNGADVQGNRHFSQVAPIHGRIVVPGDMTWRPNYLGLQWFIKEVLPLLYNAGPQAPPMDVHVAGRMDQSLKTSLNRISGITAVPNPSDMAAELAQAQLVVVPVLASSGTRLRILEAFSCARPVVTTPAGAFGLPVTDREELIIASSAIDLSRAITEIMSSVNLSAHLQSRAEQFVENYDWQAIGSNLLSSYNALIQRNQNPGD